MAKRRKPTNAIAKPNRTGVPVYGYVKQELRKALDEYLESTRPEVKLAAVLSNALEDFLQKKGFWPPSEAKE